MVFLFILDVITSVTLSIAVKCGTWVVCKSANGLYYIYKQIKPNNTLIQNNEIINDKEYIILTREEYDTLSSTQTIVTNQIDSTPITPDINESPKNE